MLRSFSSWWTLSSDSFSFSIILILYLSSGEGVPLGCDGMGDESCSGVALVSAALRDEVVGGEEPCGDNWLCEASIGDASCEASLDGEAL
ncbi:hypothetical protein HAX54_050493, partial [Datura stramonium]|nr:hypothetical protein [Datura stramonium]